MRDLLTFTLLMAVGPLASTADDEGGRLMSRLLDLLKKEAATPSELVPSMTVRGSEVEIAGHRLRITPVSERVLRTEGQFISAARFEIALDSRKQNELIAGSIGISSDSADNATSNAVVEWYVAFGSPILRSIADRSPDLTVGNFRVYTGALLVRGQAPDELISGQVITPDKVLKAISDTLPRVNAKVHSVQIMVVVAPDGPITGECRVDSQLSAIAFASLQQLSWPKGLTPYMYKQSYVLR
ncbi:DUF6348 family protein [Candidatus Nitrospira neomarina]|uniref:DUF6348 family protein n=1 Tax=Candidatus Nitrospira neomarina TaxID=3020899 RepID=A0AA96GQY1_9BACT|nr:DUF6348 family protein [Candidatus Nitrospira neomarina]WNM63693.1 DUF6348 family protein [Candidatus Nitrospira neomarina]